MVRWTPAARRDRRAIWFYLAERDRAAADRMDELFGRTVTRLSDFPMLGHPGDVEGTRELTPHRSYRIIYEIVSAEVWILTIVHTARQWPPVE